MAWRLSLNLEEFLSRNPGMRLSQYEPDVVVLKGTFHSDAQMEGRERICDSFELTIEIEKGYPRTIPTVYETGGRFPRNQDHHTYKDGSLCLGSDVKLKSILQTDSGIDAFARNILIPFLYSLNYKIRYGVFPYGDLDHGEAGLIYDYESLFGVSGKRAVLGVLSALGARKRVANKMPCPCGCNRRLGRCDYRFSIAQWRDLDRRRWFRTHLRLFSPIKKPKKKNKKKKV